ncbi:FAD-dependent monooxygenase [Streptomyces sp. NPDC002835]
MAGGGPVGMFLASEPAGYGVRTLVVEAENAVSEWPRAPLAARQSGPAVRWRSSRSLDGKRKYRALCGR